VATRNSQRIGIWVIVVVLTVGTLGAFFLPILINSNSKKDIQDQEAVQKQLLEQQKLSAASHSASSKPLDGYTAAPFDASTVSELTSEELVAGTGKEVKANSTIEANYFGWTADGKIFDSTNQNGTVTPASFSLEQVIKGWTKGLTGAKEGAVRKLLIPTDLAYGPSAAEQGQPAGPLAFIVQIKSVK
jgi:FKBP-type peptidyl-prolyl cis-trans isomerase